MELLNSIKVSLSLWMYAFIFYMAVTPTRNYSSVPVYNDLPEHYVINSVSNHINVGHGILLSKLNCGPPVTRAKDASCNTTTKSSMSHIGTLILLVCGDIHPCPGPNYKYPCGICQKPVRKNQKGIQCDICNLWHHTKCIKMPDDVYFRLGENIDEPWECDSCHFPYAFTDSFFNTSGVSMQSSSSEDTIPDSDILQDFVNLRKKHPKNFIVSYININSLQFKFSELSLILQNKLVDCLFVAETKLNDSHLDSCFKLDNYSFYRRDNPRDGGGGLVCFIRSDIPSYVVKPDCGLID